MGKHADPDPRWFWLSLAAAAGKTVAVLALAGLVVFGLTRWLGGADPESGELLLEGAAGQAQPTPSADASVADDPALEPDPAEDDASEDDTSEDEAGDETGDDPADEETSSGVSGDEEAEDGGDDGPVRGTVQVLDGAGDPDAVRDAVAALEELGYEVVAQSRAARRYPRTTVFWSDGFEDEAEQLREADDRFAALEENERLAPSINLHVVVGEDWETGE